MYTTPIIPEGFILAGFAPCLPNGVNTELYWCDANGGEPEDAFDSALMSCTVYEHVRPVFMGLPMPVEAQSDG